VECEVDRIVGKISFWLDGEAFGPAFEEDEKLKEGPLYFGLGLDHDGDAIEMIA